MKDIKTISGLSRVLVTKDQVSCDLGGEEIILNLRSGRYFGLDAVGTRIWQLIQEPKTVNAVLDCLLEEYEVEPERCERDLVALLEQLADANLIELQNESEG